MYQIKMTEIYCVNCKKNTANKNSCVRRTRYNRSMHVSNGAICGKKKWGFIKNQN